MSETITQTRIEDAVAKADAFLQAERGASLDGAFAGAQIAQRVATVQQRAEALLRNTHHILMNSLRWMTLTSLQPSTKRWLLLLATMN